MERRKDDKPVRDFDPFSMSAGIDKDFDDTVFDTEFIIEKLRERGSL